MIYIMLLFFILLVAPRFFDMVESIQVEYGLNTTLSCNVMGNPTPDFLWIHKKTGKVL